jgi:succinate dehydrogenase subunit C
MSAPLPPYTGFRAKWYRAPVSTWWWLHRRAYVLFILREVSSVFVAWSVVFLLILVHALGDGPAAYADFLDWADTPWVVVLNLVTLCFLVYHAVTWFQLTPKAMVLRLAGRRLSDRAVAGQAFAAWVVVTAVVAWLVLRG